jgi:hypothetical protein
MQIRRPSAEVISYPIAAFDVETRGDKRKFVHGVVVDSEGAYHFTNKEEMREHLTHPRYSGYRVFATNLEYDLTSVFDGFEYGIVPLYFRSRLINAKYRDRETKTIYFLDTGNLTNRMSVARMGKIVGLDKYETPPWLLGKNKGHNPWTCDKHGKEYCIPCYCERDTEITYLFAVMFQEVCIKLGCNLKNTVGSTGIDLWKRCYMAEGLRVPPLNYNEFCRPAYHGGRTENFVTGTVEEVNGYDLNSLYPFVHVTGSYPHPNYLEHRKSPSSLDKILACEGVMECVIDVPPMLYPPLGLVYNHRLYYPIGRLEGQWTIAEIREALSLGCKIVSVGYVVYADRVIIPLRDYMIDVYELRKKYRAEGSPMNQVIKLMLNAPTGKFGQRTDNELYHFMPIDDVDSPDQLKGRDIYYFPQGVYVTKPVLISGPPDYINTLWASQMTSLARSLLMRTVRELGESAFYIDTDSVHTTEEIPTGKELGDWKQEFTRRTVVYRGAKYYYSDDQKDPSFSKIRGIPARLHRDYISDGHAICNLVAHPKTANKRGFDINDWYRMDKRDRDRYPRRRQTTRIKSGGNYYQTEPFTVEEIKKMLKDAPPPPPLVF